MKAGQIFVLIIFPLLFACVEKEKPATNEVSENALDRSKFNGTGSFQFIYSLTGASKVIPVYYHMPAAANRNTPILLVFHGNERNGEMSRNELIEEANLKNFIVLAPEYSQEQFPGGDGYNLGNVFIDGDNPSAETLNNEAAWTFSTVSPIFNYFKETVSSSVLGYDVFGHSAGAQFVHRLMIFKPNVAINRAVVSAAGWYTLLDTATSFPYGIGSSPAAKNNFEAYLLRNQTIIVGEFDNDPNASDVRHNEIVDRQGLTRLARAQNYYSDNMQKATNWKHTFNWKFQILQKVGHDYAAAANAAAAILYP